MMIYVKFMFIETKLQIYLLYFYINIWKFYIIYLIPLNKRDKQNNKMII